MRFKPPFSAVLGIFLSRQKAAVISRKVAEGLRFDCGQYGFRRIFAVSCSSPHTVEEPQKTAV